jgi:hypothetical protein
VRVMERIRAWRICDTCGGLSLCPVWIGACCNHIVSRGRGMETCSGHYHEVAHAR